MFVCLKFGILLLIINTSLAADKLCLNGNDWELGSTTGNYTGVSAIVPGSVYTDLVRAAILNDPYYRYNDQAYRWVAWTDWKYKKTFSVDKAFLNVPKIDLSCEGLDTHATVFLNGIQVGQGQNMFVKYDFPVKEVLKEGKNSIQIVFRSPIQEAAEAQKAYYYDVPPTARNPVEHGENHVNFIRKEQCSFSWDWGPSFPTMGIWKSIYLLAYHTANVEYITAQTTRDFNNSWLVLGSVYLDQPVKDVVLNITLTATRTYTIMQKLLAPSQKVDFKIKIIKPVSEWMPNEYGSQQLYDLKATMTTSNGEVSSKSIRIGFRTVELIQENIVGSDGFSFYFKINGIPIFMKGSNWIPADSFQERITYDYVYQLLKSVQKAHMNMLRVWGGGVYESDIFYELADEMGIMVWQDFMFACALYPADAPFLQNVNQEVLHQVRRLQHHPSIAIWAGNNENEPTILSVDKRYYTDYLALYIDTIRQVVVGADTSRPFVSSSPSNGIQSEREGWVAGHPQSELYGDVHHYDYNSDNWNWTVYPHPRFTSEFGFQSWCSLDALKSVSIESDLSWNSNFSNYRQHHANGNAELVQEWSRHFQQPVTSTPVKQFENFIYLTQINQAMGIQTETELYRRLQGRLIDGKGHTMGALYWQLNDIWQAPTWASIEYGGNWKMLHYYAQRFFNQTILSAVLEGDTVTVYYVDDHVTGTTLKTSGNIHDAVLRFQPTEQEQLTLYVMVFSWNQLGKPLKMWTTNFTKPTVASTIVYQNKLDALLSEAKCNRKSCFIYVSLDNSEIHSGPSNILLLSYFTDVYNLGLKQANVKIVSVKMTASKTFEVTIKAEAIAPFVWMEVRGISGHFSDNGFFMLKANMVVSFYSRDDASVKNIEQALTVRSLMDMYAKNV